MLYILFRQRLRTDGRVSINCRITLDGVRASEFATGVACDRKDWQQAKQSVRGCQASTDTLRQIAADVRATLNRMLYAGEHPTANELKEAYLRAGTKPREKDITTAIADFLTTEQGNRERAANTLRKYRSSLRKFETWLQQTSRPHLPVSRVDRAVMEAYCNYLRDVVKNDRNTINKDVEVIRLVVKHYQPVPLGGFAYRRKKPKPPAFLTAHEVAQIAAYRFESATLQKAADMFVFQCHTALAYADLKKFNADYLRQIGERLYIYMPRTKEPEEAAMIPVDEVAYSLMRKYKNCFHVPSNAHYNRALKQIGYLLDIKQPLTTHLARKTAAHIWLNSGMSYERVARLMGHSKIETTRLYARLQVA